MTIYKGIAEIITTNETTKNQLPMSYDFTKKKNSERMDKRIDGLLSVPNKLMISFHVVSGPNPFATINNEMTMIAKIARTKKALPPNTLKNTELVSNQAPKELLTKVNNERPIINAYAIIAISPFVN